jgi:cytoskeletal protein CcmA (bactofilin family)
MFNKDANEDSSAQPRPAQAAAGRNPAPSRSSGGATIGPSIKIKGDVSGDEDLLIQGQIEGKVKLGKHNVTIGSDGHVKADVHGRTVVVEGQVEGDLRAKEQIILRHTARVEGSIAAPRVTLEDGATFRGGIEMDAGGKDGKPVVGKRADTGREAAAERDSSSAKVASGDNKVAAGDKGSGKSISV